MFFSNYVVGDIENSGLHIPVGENKRTTLRNIVSVITGATDSPWSEVVAGVEGGALDAFASTITGGGGSAVGTGEHVTLYHNADPELAGGNARLLRITNYHGFGYKLQILDTLHSSDQWLWIPNSSTSYFGVNWPFGDKTTMGSSPASSDTWQNEQRLIIVMADDYVLFLMRNPASNGWHSGSMVWMPGEPADGHYSRADVPLIMAPGAVIANQNGTDVNANVAGLPGTGAVPSEYIGWMHAMGMVPSVSDFQNREILQPLVMRDSDWNGRPIYFGALPGVMVSRTGVFADGQEIDLAGQTWIKIGTNTNASPDHDLFYRVN